jgi:enamine deaminase RidA (YjgF/YER057c/UK114 family)
VSSTPACSQIVEIVRSEPGRSIHVAGTYGCDANFTFHEPSMEGQVRAALENIRRSLAAVGATPADVVRVKTYVTDMDAFTTEGLAEFVKFWDGTPPVSTAVQIVRLGLLTAVVEIEVYAEVD